MSIQSESLIPLRDLPSRLPRKNGKKIHVSTIYRWMRAGISGVTLESTWVGGMHCTSLEAVERFNMAVARAKGCRDPRVSQTESVAVGDSLAEAGWGK